MTDLKTNLDIAPSPIFVPIMSLKQFSGAAGVEIGVLTGWVKRGYIPTVKIGKRRLINILAMSQELSSNNG